MKKISYLLILFVGLFIFTNVALADIVCEAVNDMEYTLVFESLSEGGYLKKIIDKEGNTLQIWGMRTQRWKIKDEKYCPLSQREFKVEKYKVEFGTENGGTVVQEYDQYKVVPSDSYTTNFETDIRSKNGCSEYGTYTDCVSNPDFSCVWVDRSSGKIITDGSVTREDAYCNYDNLQYVRCGNAFDIPTYLPKIISFVIDFLKIVTPIILIFVSAISLLKAITSQKEDEMTKAKSILVRRLVIAAIIFFTINITEFVIDKVADDSESKELSSCLDCFINNNCDSNIYYKNNINGEYICRYAADSSLFSDEDQAEHCH